MASTPFTMHFDDDLRDRAEKQAQKERRTLANMIHFALEKYLNETSDEE